METNVNRLRKYSAITLGIILATAFVLVQPTMQTSYAQVSAEGIPPYDDCDLREFQGEDSTDLVEMNTVKNGEIAKTVHLEKQIYHCQTVQGDVHLILEQAIIAEIFENMTSKEITHTEVEVVSCLTVEDTSKMIGCDVSFPEEESVPLQGCEPDFDGDFWVDMNTVNKGKIVKTIDAQKLQIFCDLDDSDDTGVCDGFGCGIEKKVDRVIFTDIWENLGLPPEDSLIKKEFLGLTCVVVLAEDADGDGSVGNDDEDKPARVEACLFEDLGKFVP